MNDTEKRDSCLQKLVSASRAILTYQVGLPHGCKRIDGILSTLRDLEKSEPVAYPVFGEYLGAIHEFPTGTERLHWNRDALRERDVHLEAINRQFRDRLFDACYDILERHPITAPQDEK